LEKILYDVSEFPVFSLQFAVPNLLQFWLLPTAYFLLILPAAYPIAKPSILLMNN